MSEVEAHYERGDLRSRIDAALRDAGMPGNEPLQIDDLTAFDEFHTLGRAATVELADLAVIQEGDDVLDVGSGLGGPARVLAARYGARVTGLDATAEFTAVATWLTERTNLAEDVTFQTGDALSLPFDDASFDVTWTQHVAMNIADKGRFYRELRRVTRLGGKLAFFDLVAGAEQPIHLPVPWAETGDLNFLEAPERIMTFVEAAGFRPMAWNDVTDRATEFFRRVVTSDRDGGRPQPGRGPGIGLVVPHLAEKTANLARNFEERRLRAVQAVCEATI